MHYFDHFYCSLCPFNPTRVSELYSSIFGGYNVLLIRAYVHIVHLS
jgi:hypothetical protein